MDSLNTSSVHREAPASSAPASSARAGTLDSRDLLSRGAGTIKHSYTIPCASAFRDAVESLAQKRKVNVGDIARSVLLVVPSAVIDGFADPGEPSPEDRETVILKSGPAQGRPWRRKPRLQVRMAPGYSVEQIRKALGVALSIESGDIEPQLTPKSAPTAEVDAESNPDALFALREEAERLRAIVNVLSFDPLPDGVNTREEALHVLGFPPGARPRFHDVRSRFRILATIHHPDSSHGNHHRMSQINQAMTLLRTILS